MNRVQGLIVEAFRECGRETSIHTSIKNIMLVIEEQLTVEEAKEVKSFLRWAFFDWELRGFGPLSIDIKWNEWRKSIGSVSVSEVTEVIRVVRPQRKSVLLTVRLTPEERRTLDELKGLFKMDSDRDVLSFSMDIAKVFSQKHFEGYTIFLKSDSGVVHSVAIDF